MVRRASGIVAVAALLTAFAAEPAQAQDVLIGVKGGLNVADVSFEGDGTVSLDTDTRSGFVGGAFLNLGLSDILAVQTEVLYSQKGAELEEDGFVVGLEVDYVEIPALLMVRIPVRDSAVRPLLFGGAAVSFETSCDLTGTDGAVTVSFDCDDPDIQLERKSTDFGLVFGGGVEVEAGVIVLTADGRYNLGLVDVLDEPGSSAKNRAFSFMAGVGLRLR